MLLFAEAALLPHTALLPQTALNPVLLLLPQTALLPHTALFPHTAELPHIAELPHMAELPHIAEESEMKLTVWVVGSKETLGESAVRLAGATVAIVQRRLEVDVSSANGKSIVLTGVRDPHG